MGAGRTLRVSAIMICCILLAACGEMPEWMGGHPPAIKRSPGERVDVVLNPTGLKPDESVKDIPVEIPEQTNLDQWKSLNAAMLTAHIGLTGVTHEQDAGIGDDNMFTRAIAPSPVVAGGLVYAMDAAGIVSAHDEKDIEQVRWVDKTSHTSSMVDALGGGLAVGEGVLYASTGYGNLRALDATTGKMKWTISVGAPVRGAPAVEGDKVIVLTADNQTLAYDAATGQPRWEHRGIRETAGYFSTTSPVVSEGIVVSAYSSGELFAIRAETGSVLWSDTIGASVKTRASAVFSGIDADPIVQDGVVVVISASGEMQASALLNGRPLWQQRIGAHTTPWSAGNALFVLSDTHDVAAIFKRDGSVRWATSLAVHDARDKTKDLTPTLFGPILSANALLVLSADGRLSSFKPTTGEHISDFELAEGIVSSPVIANGAMYVVTRDAKLHKYY